MFGQALKFLILALCILLNKLFAVFEIQAMPIDGVISALAGAALVQVLIYLSLLSECYLH